MSEVQIVGRGAAALEAGRDAGLWQTYLAHFLLHLSQVGRDPAKVPDESLVHALWKRNGWDCSSGGV